MWSGTFIGSEKWKIVLINICRSVLRNACYIIGTPDSMRTRSFFCLLF